MNNSNLKAEMSVENVDSVSESQDEDELYELLKRREIELKDMKEKLQRDIEKEFNARSTGKDNFNKLLKDYTESFSNTNGNISSPFVYDNFSKTNSISQDIQHIQMPKNQTISAHNHEVNQMSYPNLFSTESLQLSQSQVPTPQNQPNCPINHQSGVPKEIEYSLSEEVESEISESENKELDSDLETVTDGRDVQEKQMSFKNYGRSSGSMSKSLKLKKELNHHIQMHNK
jgi:hypothetical protein